MGFPFKKQTVDYSDIEPNLQTGDIVLMQGLFPSSKLIETIEESDWSHAAIVILKKDLEQYPEIKIRDCEDDVLLWESNVAKPEGTDLEEKVIDLLNISEETDKAGPQLVSLKQRMVLNLAHKDDGKFAVRHLHHNEDVKDLFSGLANLFNTYYPAKFPTTYHEMIYPIEGRKSNKDSGDKEIFCSELVAASYMEFGLLSKLHVKNSYIPVDFSEKLSVGLLKRAWLGNEIIIDNDTLV